MSPGVIRLLPFLFLWQKERAPPFRTSEGSKTLPGRHLPFALPLSLRKDNFRFSRKMLVEGPLNAKEMKNKKERQRQRKAENLCPWMLSAFWSSFFSEERTCIFFPHIRRGRRPHTWTPPSFCLSFSPEKTDEKVAKRQVSIPLRSHPSFAPLFPLKKDRVPISCTLEGSKTQRRTFALLFAFPFAF